MDDHIDTDRQQTRTHKGALAVAILSVAVMFLMVGLVLGVYVFRPGRRRDQQGSINPNR